MLGGLVDLVQPINKNELKTGDLLGLRIYVNIFGQTSFDFDSLPDLPGIAGFCLVTIEESDWEEHKYKLEFLQSDLKHMNGHYNGKGIDSLNLVYLKEYAEDFERRYGKQIKNRE